MRSNGEQAGLDERYILTEKRRNVILHYPALATLMGYLLENGRFKFPLGIKKKKKKSLPSIPN